MTDLFAVFSKLVSPQGEILVPGLMDLVDPLTKQERSRYEQMNFSNADFESAVGGNVLLKDDKAEVLMGRCVFLSLADMRLSTPA